MPELLARSPALRLPHPNETLAALTLVELAAPNVNVSLERTPAVDAVSP